LINLFTNLLLNLFSSSVHSRRETFENDVIDKIEIKEMSDTEALEKKKETEEEEIVLPKPESDGKVLKNNAVFGENLDSEPNEDVTSATKSDSIGDDWGLVINQKEVKEASLADEEAMEVEVEKAEIKHDSKEDIGENNPTENSVDTN
jgi:hypothetical protein